MMRKVKNRKIPEIFLRLNSITTTISDQDDVEYVLIPGSKKNLQRSCTVSL